MTLVCDVYCDFVTFPFGILGKMWYLIVSIPDPCCLSYLEIRNTTMFKSHFQKAKCKYFYLKLSYN